MGIGNSEVSRALDQNKRNLYIPQSSEIFRLPYFRVDCIKSDKKEITKCAALVLTLLEQLEDVLSGFSDIPLYISTSTGGIKETEEVFIENIHHKQKYPLTEKNYFYDMAKEEMDKYFAKNSK